VGDPQPKSWEEWYRLARESLSCAHEEAVEYANLRFVEDQNRAARRRTEPTAPPRERPAY
jgi:hypothetical protein